MSQGDRFLIRKLNVDAPLTYRQVGIDGVMGNPDGPDDVAYYDFSQWPGMGGAPGLGGNAVFAGHVDSGSEACENGAVPPPCRAVLWNLASLVLGDEIEVILARRTYKYRVVANQSVSATSDRWHEIVATTIEESITVITCTGSFDPASRSYADRQVILAKRT